jgi:hypothetical protein
VLRSSGFGTDAPGRDRRREDVGHLVHRIAVRHKLHRVYISISIDRYIEMFI